jgi:lysozyme
LKTNQAGIDLIKRFEGLQLQAYTCPAGVLTIGVGHTQGVEPGMEITKEQAELLLEHDLSKYECQVESLAPKATSNQFSAMVSFAFNLGTNALLKSTLLRKFKAGDMEGAGNEFLRWKNVNGKPLPGLTTRREAERELFLKQDDPVA